MLAEGEDEVANVLHEIEEEEHNIHHLENELNRAESSIGALHTNLNEQNDKKNNILSRTQHLHERIDEEGANMVQQLILLLEALKELERQVYSFRSCCEQKRTALQAEVIELERKVSSNAESTSFSDDLNQSFSSLLGKRDSVKRELAAKLRAVLLLKRRLGDVPSQSELIQYERRFSELNVQIQEKHQQTRQYYATYNALLEIKELVQKETSLLNSISSQFQDAMTSTTSRMKLIDSMEAILKGTQQKVGRVQIGLHAEQKVCDALKERCSASVAEQRHCSSLLKAFQEEYAKNERLRTQTHNVKTV